MWYLDPAMWAQLRNEMVTTHQSPLTPFRNEFILCHMRRSRGQGDAPISTWGCWHCIRCPTPTIIGLGKQFCYIYLKTLQNPTFQPENKCIFIIIFYSQSHKLLTTKTYTWTITIKLRKSGKTALYNKAFHLFIGVGGWGGMNWHPWWTAIPEGISWIWKIFDL